MSHFRCRSHGVGGETRPGNHWKYDVALLVLFDDALSGQLIGSSAIPPLDVVITAITNAVSIDTSPTLLLDITVGASSNLL